MQEQKCNICNKSFKSLKKLQTHMTTTDHQIITQYRCKKCKRNFPNLANIKYHFNNYCKFE